MHSNSWWFGKVLTIGTPPTAAASMAPQRKTNKKTKTKTKTTNTTRNIQTDFRSNNKNEKENQPQATLTKFQFDKKQQSNGFQNEATRQKDNKQKEEVKKTNQYSRSTRHQSKTNEREHHMGRLFKTPPGQPNFQSDIPERQRLTL